MASTSREARALLRVDKPVIKRLISKLDGYAHPSLCWTFNGAKNPNGYGVLHLDKTHGLCYAHRVAFAAWSGPIDAGMTVEHTCRNRLCCNPAHLMLMSHQENCEGGRTRRWLHFRRSCEQDTCPRCGGSAIEISRFKWTCLHCPWTSDKAPHLTPETATS